MIRKQHFIFMIFLKINLLISTILFCCQGLASICVNINVSHEMFGVDFGMDSLVQDYDMAFADSHFSDYQLFFTHNNAELAWRVNKMSVNSCSIVLGLFTSHDCLIAGNILKKKKIIGVSPNCEHDDIGKLYPYLFTSNHPLSLEMETIGNYVNTMSNAGRIFVVHQSASVYSEAAFAHFKQMFPKSIVEIPVSLDGKCDVGRFSYKKDEPVTLVFLTYPLPSVKVLIELSNNQLVDKNVRIIGNSSWSEDISLLKSIKPILEKAYLVDAIVDIADCEKVKHSTFSKQFVKRFHRNPLDFEVLNYDVTRFVVECYKKSLVNTDYNIGRFQYCITHTKYNGVSGSFSFGNHSSFADRPQHLTNLLNRM